jgi:hypothetical protein
MAHSNFDTPLPLGPHGHSAMMCGPIGWHKGEQSAVFFARVVQGDVVARGGPSRLYVRDEDTQWRLVVEPEEGKMLHAGRAEAQGLAVVYMDDGTMKQFSWPPEDSPGWPPSKTERIDLVALPSSPPSHARE